MTAVIAVALIVWQPWAGPPVETPLTRPNPPRPAETTPPAPAEVVSVAIVAPESTLFVGDAMQITGRVTDANGQAVNDPTIEWRSQSPAVASISESGMITAEGLGSTTISAQVDDVATSFPLLVQRQRSVATRQPVATVVVTWDQNTITPGSAAQFLASPRDADGNRLSGRPISWQSSDPQVASVGSDGTVTGRSEGTARITATSEGRSGSGIVTVRPVPVASVAVSPATASIEEGATVRMSVTVRSSDGSALTGRTVMWGSSDSSVATVRSDGTVTGVSGGSATVTARVEGQLATATVTIRARPADPPTEEPEDPPEDPRPAIEQVVEAFRNAFAQRDLAAMRRVFPSMSSAQESAWRDFFTSVRELSVVYRSSSIDISGAAATVSIEGHFEYRLDRGMETQDVRVQMELRETNGAWVITSYR